MPIYCRVTILFDILLFSVGVGINGETLIIHNITRYCDGIYECVAFNDVPPAVNRVISVMVECEYRACHTRNFSGLSDS